MGNGYNVADPRGYIPFKDIEQDVGEEERHQEINIKNDLKAPCFPTPSADPVTRTAHSFNVRLHPSFIQADSLNAP